MNDLRTEWGGVASPDAVALRTAIDQGDDSAMPALADLLEEVGDPRADGLRRVLQRMRCPYGVGGSVEAGWTRTARVADDGGWSGFLLDAIPADTFARLPSGRRVRTEIDRVGFLSRSAAFLALAEVLADGDD